MTPNPCMYLYRYLLSDKCHGVMYILLQYIYNPNSETIIKFNELKKEAFVYFQSFTAVTLV